MKKEPRGKFAVIAGRRRLLALSRLAEEGKVKATMPVPCRIAPKDADLPEISLTENVMRVAMHPADEFEAFQRLIATGKSVADVAARFGVTEAVVLRRLALARVSPTLLTKYRAGELNLELLQAFTLTDDHNAQEEVWSQLQPWDRKPHTVRQMLASEDIPASDKRVRFVGLAEYEAAGGTIRRDLFAEGEVGTYIADAAKLNRLVADKLQTLGEATRAEGWKWVEIQPEMEHQSISRYRRVYAPELPLSAEAQTEIDSLVEERDNLVNQLDNDGDDAEDADGEPLYDRIDEIDRRIQAIRRNRKAAYSDEARANCGVVVSIGHNGEPAFVYGLLRKEDEKASAAQEARTGDMQPTEAVPEPEQESPAYSAALIETLTQHKTAAIAAELSQHPTIALAALVHALVLSEFGLDLQLYRSKSCVQISTREADVQRANEALPFGMLEQQKREWLEKLATAEELWTWFREQDQQTMLELLAYCVARTVNGVRAKSDAENSGSRLEHADALARALAFDMGKWFTPTAENFFSKIPKSRIAEALAEGGKPATPEALKLKKPELAAFAESEIKGTNWLPEPIRIAVAG